MKTTGLLAVILGTGLLLSGGHAAGAAETNNPVLIASEFVVDGNFAALRLAHVADGLAEMTEWRFKELTLKHHLKGVVLDLRFAHGDGYAEAASLAGLFLAAEKPLVSVDGRPLKSASKKSALTLPVVALVNRETAGAAELLAALLREQRVALLLGSRTAGQAGGKIFLASGATLSSDGLQPDITEEVSLANERIYIENAYAEITKVKSTNAATVGSAKKTATTPRLNEAELVRRQREGLGSDDDTPLAGAKLEAARPAVRDPVLARALDLLKGLAAAKQTRQF